MKRHDRNQAGRDPALAEARLVLSRRIRSRGHMDRSCVTAGEQPPGHLRGRPRRLIYFGGLIKLTHEFSTLFPL
jgi:hypothetical protein